MSVGDVAGGFCPLQCLLLSPSLLPFSTHLLDTSSLAANTTQVAQPPAPVAPLPKRCQCSCSQQQCGAGLVASQVVCLISGQQWGWVILHLIFPDRSTSSRAACLPSSGGSSRTSLIPHLLAAPGEFSPAHPPPPSHSLIPRQTL